MLSSIYSMVSAGRSRTLICMRVDRSELRKVNIWGKKMNIGGNLGKIIKNVTLIAPDQMKAMQSDLSKEIAKSMKAEKSAKSLGSIITEISGIMGQMGGALEGVIKAAAIKPPKDKGGNGPDAALKKDTSKIMENMRATMIKSLEQKIAQAEKELAELKSFLADAKGTKSATWFK